MGAKKGCAFCHSRLGRYGKRRDFVNGEQVNIQVSYFACTCENIVTILYRAIGGVDRKTYAVELEFFDEVIPQVKNK